MFTVQENIKTRKASFTESPERNEQKTKTLNIRNEQMQATIFS